MLLQQAYKNILDFMPTLLIGLLIFSISWAVAVFLKKLIIRLGKELETERQQVVHLIASVSHSGLILIGLISALGTMGINVSALVAGLGLTGFALGFALKDALSNLLAGALILIYQPFRYGDRITVVDCEGEVVEINLRYTVLIDGSDKYLVPNSVLFNNKIRINGTS